MASSIMHLEQASLRPIEGVADMLLELGAGETGFGGTAFGRGECSLEAFLIACVDGTDPAKTPPGFVPQTVFWVIDDEGSVVGMTRVRHPLNAKLLQSGGNIGYYIRPGERGKGYGTRALRMALDWLAGQGANRALVTASPNNTASTRVILANGGKADGQGIAADSGEVVNRYWIDL